MRHVHFHDCQLQSLWGAARGNKRPRGPSASPLTPGRPRRAGGRRDRPCAEGQPSRCGKNNTSCFLNPLFKRLVSSGALRSPRITTGPRACLCLRVRGAGCLIRHLRRSGGQGSRTCGSSGRAGAGERGGGATKEREAGRGGRMEEGEKGDEKGTRGREGEGRGGERARQRESAPPGWAAAGEAAPSPGSGF